MKKTILAASIFAFTIIGNADARDQIKIVGSSTVYPFATVVAERFGKTSGFKTPVIESQTRSSYLVLLRYASTAARANR